MLHTPTENGALARTLAEAEAAAMARPPDARKIYQRLTLDGPTPRLLAESRRFLEDQLLDVKQLDDDLPASPADLEEWMLANHRQVASRYEEYLARRKTGAPRHFFANRAHALHFLRGVAPTKLVDGAWLYSTTRNDPAAGTSPAHLVRTYLEELGNGDPGKNHVLLYRRLLASHGLEQWQDLANAFYIQGAIQLALGFHGEDFLPEVVGFNLGYEQLPLHLLITAYELDELGLDPYYFTLHVTVDNADTGHARRAVEAVEQCAPQFGTRADYWERVRRGYRLNELGMGTAAVIQSFDIEAEVLAIFQRKSVSGHGAHSDYCRIGGRTVNEWLSDPVQVPYFIDELKRGGWIKLDAEPSQSRFWQLLQGERARMFGVFSPYELQMIHDWMRGAASADGRAYDAEAPTPSYRVMERKAALQQGPLPAHLHGAPGTPEATSEALALDARLSDCTTRAGAIALLHEAMSPLSHWKPAGLHATRIFDVHARLAV